MIENIDNVTKKKKKQGARLYLIPMPKKNYLPVQLTRRFVPFTGCIGFTGTNAPKRTDFFRRTNEKIIEGVVIACVDN